MAKKDEVNENKIEKNDTKDDIKNEKKSKKTMVKKSAANKNDSVKAKAKTEADSDKEKTAKSVAKKSTKKTTKKTVKKVERVEEPTVSNVEANAEIKSTKKDSEVKKTIKKQAKRATKKVKATAKTVADKIKDTTKKIKEVNVKEENNKVVDMDEFGLDNFAKYLFHEGKNYKSYQFMGAHLCTENNVKGVRFTTWAPHASKVYVVNDETNWNINDKYEMKKASEGGIWTVFLPGIQEGTLYKYAVLDSNNKMLLKSDPYGFYSEVRPNTASIVADYDNYKWKDSRWIKARNKKNIYQSAVNIYEAHLGSWKLKENGDYYSYKELAEIMPKYVKEMGYTHVELMPVMEHPLDDSWGYQVTGYYSVTSRYGSINDFKYLVEAFHKEGIGVILDWVPGHFCKDSHGLYRFDGTPVYEYSDERLSENKGWGAANFDLGKREVKSFLVSNAVFWFENYHIDGLRVDAVANMLYLDYDRRPGEWKPNKYGENKNLEAIQFFKELNTAVFKEYPSVLMIAEESTAWPLVTRPADIGGLGFNFKWNMGWMNDILQYVQIDPKNRKYHHQKLTFPSMYQYSENFILPISHDEVVHGKKSLIDKMWGDRWNKFAGLRLFIAFMLGHPGKKTLFMGSEFGQFIEWRHKEQLEWQLIDEFKQHADTQKFFKEINNFYKDNEALWKYDYDGKGFEWIDADNNEQSILVFMRKSDKPEDTLIFICNFTSSVYYDFKIGVPYYGEYVEKFNTDSEVYGGSDQVIEGILVSKKEGFHNQKNSLLIKVPPMAALVIGVKSIYKEKKVVKKSDTVNKKEEENNNK